MDALSQKADILAVTTTLLRRCTSPIYLWDPEGAPKDPRSWITDWPRHYIKHPVRTIYEIHVKRSRWAEHCLSAFCATSGCVASEIMRANIGFRLRDLVHEHGPRPPA
jgi:hypothetical protein